MKKLFFLILFLTTGLFAYSQPTTITYQGKLLDASNMPVNESAVEFTFAIYDSETGGNKIWPPNNSAATKSIDIVNGLYSVILGTASGNDEAIEPSIFNGITPYLEVGVNSSTLPRTRITSVPFSMLSNNLSSNAWASPGSIGSTTPNAGAFTSLKLGTGTTTYTFPNARGTNGQIIQTDANGNLSWVNPPSGGSLTNFTESNYTHNSKTGVKLLATNAATNVDFVLQPKGSGGIIAQQPDGNATGGNNRGNKAVDFQTLRDDNAQVASGNNSFVGSGSRNTASGDHSFVGGGYKNNASGLSSVISGGELNTASGIRSFIGGGFTNLASGGYSVIAGGQYNVASGTYSFVGGGAKDTASGDYTAVIYGSNLNTDSKTGAVMIGDNSNSLTLATANNQFTARFAGGYRLFSNSTATVGVQVAASGNSWSSISDSTKKENFKPADEEKVLESFRNFRLGSWNYKGQDKEEYRHYGPMAQEWDAAFGYDGIGKIGCDTLLASADVDGIAYIAIKGLEKRTSEQAQIIKSQSEMIKQLQDEIALMKKELASAQTLNEAMLDKFVKLTAKLSELLEEKSNVLKTANN